MTQPTEHLAEMIGGPQDGEVLRISGTQVHNRLVFPVRSKPPGFYSYAASFVDPSSVDSVGNHEYELVYHHDGVARYQYRGVFR